MQRDPWTQTLILLRCLNHVEDAAVEAQLRYSCTAEPIRDGDRPFGLKVRVTGRTTSRTVTVNWCSVSCGHYGDQIWRHAIASRNGFCALSGDEIRRGDAIYKPSSGRATPANADAMILATHIEHMAVDV